MVRSPTHVDPGVPGWRSLRGGWLWLVPPVFFAFVALLEATHAWIGYRLAGQPVIGFTLNGQPLSWLGMVARALPSWLTLGLLAPFVIFMTRRVPLSGPALWRSIGVHTVSAVVFAATFLCAASYLRYRLFLEARPDLTWRLTALRYYSVYFNTFFLNYWAIVAVYSAFLRQERRRETLMLEKQLTNARLAALQAQIRPHFLFNTLNAISALARAGETRTVIRMLAGLADLLRAAFGESGSAVIPLREELKLVRQYLDLEKLRFPDRFNVSVRAEAAALDAGVPRFLLQPVVENAVRHGIAASAGVGSIAIDARLRDGVVEVQVRDSGPGPRGGASGGTGLNNTRDRLAELYAGRASLELAAAPGGGALVTLRLPHSAAVVGAAT